CSATASPTGNLYFYEPLAAHMYGREQNLKSGQWRNLPTVPRAVMDFLGCFEKPLAVTRNRYPL
ncbi:MAG TPA: hypothetical protein PLR65_12965, partial [Anaerolineales bacterium]|nr:hypothetical protein [Anaerolineales bacterium]